MYVLHVFPNLLLLSSVGSFGDASIGIWGEEKDGEMIKKMG
jgi:hypothetical protein